MASSTVAGVSNWREAFLSHPGLAVTPENYDRLMAAQAAPQAAPEPAPEPEPEPVAAVEPEPAPSAPAAPRTPPRPVRPSAGGGAS